MEEELKKSAKLYADIPDNVDPDDVDERYYQAHRCELYDAFLAGARAYEALKI